MDILVNMEKQFVKFRNSYGLLGLAAVLAVLIKYILFYKLVGTEGNFILVTIVSCLLTALFFKSFKNKWIPTGIYVALSILLFADITYCSFFNKYLSVDMLGAAGMLGDITASIKEVMRPANFMMFFDVIIIFATLLVKRSKSLKAAIHNNENSDDEILNYGKSPKSDGDEKKNQIWSRVRKNRNRRLLNKCKKILLENKFAFAIPTIIIAILILSPFSNLGTSVSNQEIYTYHIKDIGKLLGIGNNGSLEGFSDTYQKEKEGPLFGVAAGRNLILIQVESLQNFVVGMEYNGQEITPNINKLIAGNNIYFDNFYQQVGSGNTSDAEFAINNSLYGTLESYTNKIYGDKNYFRGLPRILSEKGYDTAVFHGHEDRNFWNREKTYQNAGFNKYYGGLTGRPGGVYEMTDWMGWGLADSEFFPQTLNYMKDLKEPFYSMVITLSNHHPYEMLDKYSFIDLLPDDEGTIVGNYINSAAYTDYALGLFLDGLVELGVYDRSMICIYGDHAGLSHSKEIDKSMEKFLGKPYDFDEMMKVPLIINIPKSEITIKQTVSKAGGQVDFLPTVAYLMGFQELETLYMGHNMLTEAEGFVAEQTFMIRGSFFKDNMAFEMSRDGVFENGRAWNTRTGEILDPKDYYNDYLRSLNVVDTSEYVLKNDLIKKMYMDGEFEEDVFPSNKN